MCIMCLYEKWVWRLTWQTGLAWPIISLIFAAREHREFRGPDIKQKRDNWQINLKCGCLSCHVLGSKTSGMLCKTQLKPECNNLQSWNCALSTTVCMCLTKWGTSPHPCLWQLSNFEEIHIRPSRDVVTCYQWTNTSTQWRVEKVQTWLVQAAYNDHMWSEKAGGFLSHQTAIA